MLPLYEMPTSSTKHVREYQTPAVPACNEICECVNVCVHTSPTHPLTHSLTLKVQEEIKLHKQNRRAFWWNDWWTSRFSAIFSIFKQYFCIQTPVSICKWINHLINMVQVSVSHGRCSANIVPIVDRTRKTLRVQMSDNTNLNSEIQKWV